MSGSWLLVSKPIRPPLDDGTTRLCETLVRAFPRGRPLSYFGDPRFQLRPGANDEVIDRSPMGHAPTLSAKASVLREMLTPSRRRQPLHLFFTPNAATSRVLSTLRVLTPRRPIVQTVTSAHRVERFAGLLRRLDRIIVLSDHARGQLVRAGVPEDKVVRIHPAVPLVDPNDDAGPPSRRLLYAGDLDGPAADRLIAIGRALGRPEFDGWTLVIACRPKGEGDVEARGRIRRGLADQLRAGSVELRGRVERFDELLRGCGLQLFVASHARNKVDLPVTVLEGLARGLGVVMVDARPMTEILDRAREHDLEVGMRAPAAELVDAVAEACADEGRVARWSTDGARLIRAVFDPAAMASSYVSVHEALA